MLMRRDHGNVADEALPNPATPGLKKPLEVQQITGRLQATNSSIQRYTQRNTQRTKHTTNQNFHLQVERVRLSARALEGLRSSREQDVLHYQWCAAARVNAQLPQR